MNQQFRQRQFPAGNPLANVLVVVAGIIVISLSLALGFVVLLGIAGFMLIMAAVFAVRNWWARQRFGRPADASRARPSPRPGQRLIIEGEFQQVRNRDPDDKDA